VAVSIGVLTASDRASRGIYEDRSGKVVVDLLTTYLRNPWQPVYRVVPDDQPTIEAELKQLVDEVGCCLVITTGGTGPAPRDVTPEATTAVCQKLLPGFGELMRTVSLRAVPTAILSRQTAGIRGSALIVNLPGKPRSIQDCLQAVFPAIPYCLDLIGAPPLECDPAAIQVFRPQQQGS